MSPALTACIHQSWKWSRKRRLRLYDFWLQGSGAFYSVSKPLLMKRGTGGSNPLPSRGESAANLTSSIIIGANALSVMWGKFRYSGANGTNQAFTLYERMIRSRSGRRWGGKRHIVFGYACTVPSVIAATPLCPKTLMSLSPRQRREMGHR